MIMPLYKDGIDKVRAFELPAGIWADGRIFGEPRVALIRWQSNWNDKFHQVYVNGQYAGSTIEAGQRQIIVQLPNSFETAARIEVFAVEPEEVNADFSSELVLSVVKSGRVKIRLLRKQDFPIDSSIWIYFDNGTGQIDYNKPLNVFPIWVWPCWQDKAGFGLSRFGEIDFGYDGAAAVGFGKGFFGGGEFGFGTDTIEWTSPELGKGTYKFAIKLIDDRGNESTIETEEITVIPAVKPAGGLDVFSFDKTANQLVLNVF
jgi:hypothetical protein